MEHFTSEYLVYRGWAIAEIAGKFGIWEPPAFSPNSVLVMDDFKEQNLFDSAEDCKEFIDNYGGVIYHSDTA